MTDNWNTASRSVALSSFDGFLPAQILLWALLGVSARWALIYHARRKMRGHLHRVLVHDARLSRDGALRIYRRRSRAHGDVSTAALVRCGCLGVVATAAVCA